MKKKHWLWGEGTGSSLILNYFPRFQGLIPIHDNFNTDPHCIFGPIFAFLPIFILTKQQSQLQRTLAAHREPTSCSFFCCYHHVLLPSGNWFTSPSVTPNWDSHIQKQHTYVLQPERNDLIKPPTPLILKFHCDQARSDWSALTEPITWWWSDYSNWPIFCKGF